MSVKGVKNVSRIQVDNSIIVNNKISQNSFGLYIVLKSISYLDNDKRVAKFHINQIKKVTGWIDNRTLTKHFNALTKLGLISGVPSRINTKTPIEVRISDMDGKGFTQVDRKTVDKIIGTTNNVILPSRDRGSNVFGMALRLFYYYEKNYNESYGSAFPGYRAIRADTGISYAYIKDLNDFFHDKGMVMVVSGSVKSEEDMYGNKSGRKSSNNYIPVCNRANRKI